jgi:hypothetical protein
MDRVEKELLEMNQRIESVEFILSKENSPSNRAFVYGKFFGAIKKRDIARREGRFGIADMWDAIADIIVTLSKRANPAIDIKKMVDRRAKL